MAQQSGIEWTDATWNPVVGCSKVSPGCAHCYAETVHATRMDGRFGYPTFRPWTPANADHNVTLMPERLDQPLRWRKPRMVFVNSMSDLFHEQVPDAFIGEVFKVMVKAQHHVFQVLTKRPERMLSVLRDRSPIWRREPASNVWLGTSIENRRYVGRADALRETPAAVRFISAEPLLGPLMRDGGDVYPWGVAPPPDATFAGEEWADDYRGPELDLTGIDWLIAGGESGTGARPMRAEWVRDLRESAAATGTAFFFKQWGGRTPKAGGRELDGRTWDEMPTPAQPVDAGTLL